MKLRNLFFASLAVCAFTACSNDDDSANQQANALVLNLSTEGNITKASADGGLVAGSEAEDKVKDVTVLIFNDKKELLYQKGVTVTALPEKGGDNDDWNTQYSATISDIQIPQGAQCVVIANRTPDQGSAFSDYQPIKTTLDTENGTTAGITNFVMTSSFQDITIANGAATATVQIERVVARVDFAQVGLAWTSSNATVAKAEKAKLKIENVYIVNATTSSYIFPQANGNLTDANAQFVAGYDYKNQAIESYLAKAPTTAQSTPLMLTPSEAAGTYTNVKGAQFYVLENRTAASQTTLIIAAKIYKENGTDLLYANTRYYAITVHPNEYITRNYIYSIKATITGIGSEDPETPEVIMDADLTLQVLKWHKIVQTEDNVEK